MTSFSRVFLTTSNKVGIWLRIWKVGCNYGKTLPWGFALESVELHQVNISGQKVTRLIFETVTYRI